MSSPTRLAAFAGALVLGFALSACGGASTPAGTSGPSPVVGEIPAHNDADVRFAQMMIVHHRDAIEMAEMAPARTTDRDVQVLAADIAAAQGPEIDLLVGWLEDWGAEIPDEHAGMAPMEHGDVMPGAMSDAQMAQLEAAKGAQFDTAFLTMMIDHHQGAIEMAQEELAAGADPAALELADAIVTDQSAQIAEMERMLGS